MEPARPPLDCPFVGLQPYAEEHREYFFGRDRERRIIAANLYAARLSVLYGASGVGKSSTPVKGTPNFPPSATLKFPPSWLVKLSTECRCFFFLGGRGRGGGGVWAVVARRHPGIVASPPSVEHGQLGSSTASAAATCGSLRVSSPALRFSLSR